MNWSELVLGAVIGAALGAAVNEVVPRALQALRSRNNSRAAARRRALFASGAVRDWLIAYYTKRGLGGDLFDCRFGHYESKIPFLTCRAWSSAVTGVDPNMIVKWSSTDPVTFPVDNSLLEELRRQGKTFVGNQPTMYLDRLDHGQGRVVMHVKVCEYFQMVTRLGGLERETLQAAGRSRGASTDLRDQYFPSLSQAARVYGKPFSVGCVGVIAASNGGTWEFLIQTRSHKTITYGGFKCGIPTFGLEPILPVPERIDPEVVTFNFVREYCEELFSYDELIELGRVRRIDPYWFYSLPEARELLEALEDGSAHLSFLGFGFDALNGTATICVLLEIWNAHVIDRLRRKASPNWEVEPPDENDNAIEFVDMRSPKLEQWLRERRLHSGAAYALSQAIRVLTAKDSRNTLPTQ